jgi:beta-aspartyl-peptidase (threonine type)
VGEHDLAASIMDGRTMSCGAVAGIRTVKNPISLARQVMEKSEHVLLAGSGAETFADEVGAGRVGPDYFFTPRMREIWQRYQEDEGVDVSKLDLGLTRGTIGVVAYDQHGNLAAATSTGGVCFKRPGRIGDSPIVGAGTYARNGVCAVSCTGRGEEFIRNSVAHSIAALMKYKKLSLPEAVRQIIHEELAADVGAAIAVDRDGTISMEFNTQAMLRGAADSSGRFETRIWEDEEK